MSQKEILGEIQRIKEELGKELVILAHYYQHDDIVRYADFVGDSLQLARVASQQETAKYIVFCAVSFMAEMARILCLPEQEVFHPEFEARCPLADMADIGRVESAWERLTASGRTVIPVVYVNSNSDLKAFCGRHGGMVCTSANAKQVFAHVLSGGGSLLFFPDENLGINTAHSLGMDKQQICSLSTDGTPFSPDDMKNFRDMKVFVWKGYCYVHTDFTVSDIEKIRNEHEGIRVIVHPECTPDVCSISDFAGSTSFIKDQIEKADPGTKWAVGTEWHFVHRIAVRNPDKLVFPLRMSECNEMSKVFPERLLRVLEGIREGKHVGKVAVEKETAIDAKQALERMLRIG